MSSLIPKSWSMHSRKSPPAIRRCVKIPFKMSFRSGVPRHMNRFFNFRSDQSLLNIDIVLVELRLVSSNRAALILYSEDLVAPAVWICRAQDFPSSALTHFKRYPACLQKPGLPSVYRIAYKDFRSGAVYETLTSTPCHRLLSPDNHQIIPD